MRGARAAIGSSVAIAAWLCGCAASPPATVPAPPAAAVPLDASYDWHVLLAAPFGSLLKDVPLGVHEVLLFRDEANTSAGQDPECYAVNGTPPRFLAHSTEDYLLCFSHDRLSRIEAGVRLPAADAERVLADACGLWTKNQGIPGAAGCAGADGNILFSGRLEADADHADKADSASVLLTVTLQGPISPDSPAQGNAPAPER